MTERLPVRRGPRRTWRFVAVVVALTATVVGLAALAVRDDDPGPPPPPPRVEPVPPADDAAQQARNLAAWLRENSG